MSETSTERLSDTLTPRSKEMRVSETPTELVSETPTATQITPVVVSELENLKSEVKNLNNRLEEVNEEQRAQWRANEEFQAIILQNLEDFIHGFRPSQENVQSTPALTVEDNPTEWEKMDQEKAIDDEDKVVVETKSKDKIKLFEVDTSYSRGEISTFGTFGRREVGGKA